MTISMIGLGKMGANMALQRRFRSRDESPFSDRLLAAMRTQFGGHETRKVAAP